jgi:signal transduction histidine kinase
VPAPSSSGSPANTPLTAADLERRAEEAWALRNDRPAEALEMARSLLAALAAVPPLPKPKDRPTVRIALANVVIWSLVRLGRAEEAKREADVALAAAREIDDAFGIGECHLSLQLAAWLEGNPRLALEHAHHAQEIFQHTPLYRGYARALNAVGLNLFELGDYTGAAEHLQLGREKARACGAQVTELNCLANLGLVYEALGRHEESAEVLTDSLAIRRQLGERRGLADTLLSLGEINRKLGKLHEAMPLFVEAGQVYRQLQDPVCEAQTYLSSARLHLDLGRPVVARSQLEHAQIILGPLGPRAETIEHRLLLSALCRRFPQAAVRGGVHAHQEAMEHAHVAMRIAEERQLVRYLPEIHEQMSLLYEAAGDLGGALAHYKEFHRQTREFLTREANERASRIKALHDVDRAQVAADAERQRAEELTQLNAEVTRQKEDLEHLRAELEEKVRALEQAMADRQQLETERLGLQRRLMETQRMESLGVLAGGIAHDFNNLLTIIGGYSELAASDIAPHSPARDALARVLSATRRAAQLCRGMLDYAGHSPLKLSTVQVADVVQESLALFASSSGKTHQCDVKLEGDLPPIRADASQLHQVFVNLLLNAAEALGDQQGGVVVRARQVRLDSNELAQLSHSASARSGEFVCIEVEDQGCGMDPDVRARMFDPFFTTKFTGRGLGLASVLGVVRNHHGAIDVESEVGRGTCFRIYIPVATTQPPATVARPAATQEAWRGSGTLLLADDEPDVLLIAQRVATSLGFTVVTAIDGQDALAHFLAQPDAFVAAIIDYQMPHMTGIELCQRLRSHRPGLPVLLMSGFAERDSLGKMRSEPGVGFLAKPFTLKTFTESIRTVVDGPGARPRS